MMIGLCLLMRQAAIILASLIGSKFVAGWNFMFLGMFEIDKLNAPGLAVAFMWSFALGNFSDCTPGRLFQLPRDYFPLELTASF